MMVVCASDSPRSAIIYTKARRLNFNRTVWSDFSSEHLALVSL